LRRANTVCRADGCESVQMRSLRPLQEVAEAILEPPRIDAVVGAPEVRADATRGGRSCAFAAHASAAPSRQRREERKRGEREPSAAPGDDDANERKRSFVLFGGDTRPTTRLVRAVPP